MWQKLWMPIYVFNLFSPQQRDGHQIKDSPHRGRTQRKIADYRVSIWGGGLIAW